ncbi:MAG: YhbY family RNA-binding protein [Thermoplasmatota archaeon]
MDVKDLKIKGMSLRPTVQVGKSGLTETVIKEIDSQLEKRELVKVKMLQSMGPSSGWKDDVPRIAEELKASVVEIKGGTILLHRKGRRRLGGD